MQRNKFKHRKINFINNVGGAINLKKIIYFNKLLNLYLNGTFKSYKNIYYRELKTDTAYIVKST